MDRRRNYQSRSATQPCRTVTFVVSDEVNDEQEVGADDSSADDEEQSNDVTYPMLNKLALTIASPPSSPNASSSPSAAETAPKLNKIAKRSTISNVTTSIRGQVQAAGLLRDLVNDSLEVWFRRFDKNRNGRIDFDEFAEGMTILKYKANKIESLWNELTAEDGATEITFDEINMEQAQLWNCFRRWCGKNFTCPRDMIIKMRDGYAKRHGLEPTDEENINIVEFSEALEDLGWARGFESLLFSGLDIDRERMVSAKGLAWLPQEVQAYREKEAVKSRTLKMTCLKYQRRLDAKEVVRDFKAFLIKSFGHLFRAWRTALDLNGSMNVHRNELVQACRNLQWKGDVRVLWDGLDHDRSGTATLEELDPKCARALAYFQKWARKEFGECPLEPFLRAIRSRQDRKVTYEAFAEKVQRYGFNENAWVLAKWLDWEGRKHLVAKDFNFLDIWKPVSWLISDPCTESVEMIRRYLVSVYGSLLHGWRNVFDRDSTNCVIWHEFQSACKAIHGDIDVAGAWLALDPELRGCITFREIDDHVADALIEFRMWAHDEFGSVKAAFPILDKNNSDDLTFWEFRHACRNLGFTGQAQVVFDTLDVGKKKRLKLKHIAFLDDWQSDLFSRRISLPISTKRPPAKEKTVTQALQQLNTLEWVSDTPGPGMYEIPASIGASDKSPTGRHFGSFSVALPLKPPMAPERIGPCQYYPSLRPASANKPRWSFNRANIERGLVDSRRPGKTCCANVGPGSYEACIRYHAPQYSLGCRRPCKRHPAMHANVG